MTIWLLALLLLGSLATMGHRQGAIRVAFSFVGIIMGAFLAAPLGKLLRPALMAVGLKSPVLIWILGPLLVFILILTAFKLGGLAVHTKVDVYYKYRAGDLRLALWERINRRLGACLGLFNGTLYFVLACMSIYSLSYWTTQMANAESQPRTLAIMNRLGRDLQATGVHKVARSVDRNSEEFYDAADLAGLIYNNPFLEARLARYPGTVGLGERPEFQDLATDKDFTEMRAQRQPVTTILNYPKVQAILKNADSQKAIGATLLPNLKDLRGFLETGRSQKFDDEKILGRWNFDVTAAVAAIRRAKPNILPTEMQKIKRGIAILFAKTTFIAAPDHEAILKNVPPMNMAGLTAPAPTTQLDTLRGQWKNTDGKYQLTLSTSGKEEIFNAALENSRLSIASPSMTMVFDRED